MAEDKASENSSKKMVAPGDVIRRAREKAGVSLQHVSQETLIPLVKLEALEQSNIHAVGGQAYALGYTRSIAKAIGCNSQPLVESLELYLQQHEHRQAAEAPTDRSTAILSSVPIKTPALASKLVSGGIVLVVAVVVFIMVLTGGRNTPSPEMTPMVSASVVPEPEAKPELEPYKSASFSDPNLGSGQRAEDFDVEIKEELLQEVPPVSVPDEDNSVFDTLELSFSDQCWVQIKDASDQQMIARIVPSGDNLRLSGIAPFEIVLGNAAAVSLSLNGVPTPLKLHPGKKHLKVTIDD